MIDATNTIKTAAIGGRTTVSHLIYNAIYKGTIKPIQKFHLQRKENKETRQTKAAFTFPHLNKAAQGVATVIAKEPPAQMPVLRGLVNKTATKATSAMERRIKSLKDQLKAAMGKTPNGATKSKGDGKKSLQGILKKKGTPPPPRKLLPPALPATLKMPTTKVLHAPKERRNPRDAKSHSMGRRLPSPPTCANR